VDLLRSPAPALVPARRGRLSAAASGVPRAAPPQHKPIPPRAAVAAQPSPRSRPQARTRAEEARLRRSGCAGAAAPGRLRWDGRAACRGTSKPRRIPPPQREPDR
jgi:hypothetical protein